MGATAISRARVTTADRFTKASPLPLIVGVVGLLGGVALGIVTAGTVVAQRVGEIELPFAQLSTWPMSLVGYALTYLAVFGAFAWDRLAQRRGRLRDRNFWDKPGYAKALGGLCWAAAIVGLWHIWNCAYAVAVAVEQSGVGV